MILIKEALFITWYYIVFANLSMEKTCQRAALDSALRTCPMPSQMLTSLMMKTASASGTSPGGPSSWDKPGAKLGDPN